MDIAIIDYGAGNVRSVGFALERLGFHAHVSADPVAILSARRVIFPGVGEASSAMQMLHERGLAALIPQLRQPVLGICLGMQLLCAHSEEGDCAGLGIFGAPVRRLRQAPKVPHMGWNAIHDLRGPLFAGIGAGEQVYFVHGYAVPPIADSVALADYGSTFSAALQKDNFFAVQFHPEKSGRTGERLLRNFLAL